MEIERIDYFPIYQNSSSVKKCSKFEEKVNCFPKLSIKTKSQYVHCYPNHYVCTSEEGMGKYVYKETVVPINNQNTKHNPNT